MTATLKFRVRRRWRVWLKGLIGFVLGGTGTAVSTWLIQTLAGTFGLPVDQLTFKQLEVVTVAGGFSSLCLYLAKSPLPNPKDDTNFWTEPPTETKSE